MCSEVEESEAGGWRHFASQDRGHKKPLLSGTNADWLRKRIRSGPFTLRKLTIHAEGLSFKKKIHPAGTGSPRYRP